MPEVTAATVFPDLPKLPGVFGMMRGTVIADGLFFNMFEDRPETLIKVVRHGIRGTQNVNVEEDKADRAVSQIQITETARTDCEASGVAIEFSIRFLPLDSLLHSCAGEDAPALRKRLAHFLSSAANSEGLQEVARRYARNLLNGRWVWRNRILADEMTVEVEDRNGERYTADALSLPLKNFIAYRDVEIALGAAIAESLNGTGRHWFKIRAEIRFGFKGSLEVYPSQNYVEGKPKGFARTLYKLGHPEPIVWSDNPELYADTRVMGIAALRDQKEGNALRTIDTWFPAFDIHQAPIPVEPLGANLDAQEFFRRDKATSAFVLMKKVGSLDPNSENGMFLLAALIRGGVYGEKEKKNQDRDDAKKAAQEAKKLQAQAKKAAKTLSDSPAILGVADHAD